MAIEKQRQGSDEFSTSKGKKVETGERKKEWRKSRSLLGAIQFLPNRMWKQMSDLNSQQIEFGSLSQHSADKVERERIRAQSKEDYRAFIYHLRRFLPTTVASSRCDTWCILANAT